MFLITLCTLSKFKEYKFKVGRKIDSRKQTLKLLCILYTLVVYGNAICCIYNSGKLYVYPRRRRCIEGLKMINVNLYYMSTLYYLRYKYN